MAFPVRLMLLSSICPLVFFSALFFCEFISLGLYLLFFFSTVSICCSLLAFNLHHEQRPATLLIHTTSVTTNTDIIPSSSSSCPPPPPPFRKLTYDVFLSFRGTDTRTNFTDHLYAALKQKGIYTFRDDEELNRGESIGPNLFETIEESRYVIVVFSQNYADSSWCLDELAKVAECRGAMGQTVLPVFYHVDPSDVRRQTGEHFGKAFEKHQERFGGNPDKLQRWKDALAEVGNLSGWHLKDGYESKVIQEIVEKIFTELNQIFSISEGLVGMDSHLNKMLSYLDIGCPDVRIIGICGMGGIGKTTIAQVVFETVQAQFEGCCFLENVREVIEKQGAVHLQEQLLSNLLRGSVNVQNTNMGKNIMRQRLRVLIILDDVDQEEQLEALCDRESFGPGSRIIITSRDEHLLSAVEGDKVYKVNPLTDAEALQLFSMKAFKKDQLVGKDFLKLSKEFLKYSNGLPLAIKVLGSSVHGKTLKLWSSALDRLKNNPQKKIINVLKVSFDGLEETEKKTFLDIACFFKGWNITRVIRILHGTGHYPEIDIEVLVEKSLVTLFGRELGMHDLVQELGWEIVRQECREEPERRSRLWLPNEIIHVLGWSKATSAVQSIFLECPTEYDGVLSIDNAFSNMDKLRLLKIWNVKFSGNYIRYLSNELQYLEWHECPLDSFPSDFQPDKLVELHMYFSRIERLWRGKKGWSMLRHLDLSGSEYLMSTPDFIEVPDLEELVLQNCTSLVEVHPSLGFLKKLRYLNMRNCKSIESLPPFTTLESLQKLDLSLCTGLKKFPEIEGNMKSLLELHLDGTSIEELPPSMTTKIDLPSSPPSSGKFTYDVFLSFRVKDTRTNFTDHLYAALKQKGIYTFRDDEELNRGESIGPNLLKAIEESRYVIVVFSQNYADSAWCLNELAKVAECRRVMGQTVLPVFYNVDPFEVRRQKGDHFEKAFKKHQERSGGDPNKLQTWKDALAEVGNLSGWPLQNGYESKVIQEIVEKIFTELNQIFSISEGLVGMDSHLNEMLSYLDIGCLDVRIIGICGMGGIGKTTIAQVVFETVQAQFEGCCFLENVREVIEKQGAVHLQEQLLSNLLRCSVNVLNTKMGKDIMRQRLRTKMILIILDDVDQEEQLEALCDRESFGPGSRIIITSRYEHLLSAVEGDKVYKVNPLTDAEALQLFCTKAFKKDQLVGKDFLKLSKEFLKYANGLPLAIKVLGSSVHGKTLKLWSTALDRLKNNPKKKIINVLKVSFDGLEETEKKTFLDIACFFKGWDIARVKRILHGTGHCPDDIEVLIQKSLVTLFGRTLGMHDLVQELGREIVRQECREEPGKRSRLWLPNEIIHVLGHSKGMSAVQSIFLECPTEYDGVLSIDNAFSNMDGLRLLKIWNVKFSGNYIRYLSNELQYLEWHECPLDSFPSDFQPDKLVELHMYFSRIEQLWRGKKGWSMLRHLDLSGSEYLMSTPDFIEVPDLEELVLQNCTSLVRVHPSLGFLKKLRYLNMRNCKSIESLPPFTTLESLQKLDLSLCTGLKKFPSIERNMKSLLELHLDGTSIEELPPSIDRLTGLTMLILADCKNLLHLPNTIGCLTSLRSLYLTDCSKLDEIPENLNGMKCLETLAIDGTSIRELSFIIGTKNLQYLSCRGCKCLVSESCKDLASLSSLIRLDLSCCNLMDGEFLNDFSSLISLEVLDLSGNCFVRLPESISQLLKLKTLRLSNCRQLQLLPKKLPFSLDDVYAEGCTSLTDYPNLIKVLNSPESGVTIVNSSQSYAMSTGPEIAGESISARGVSQLRAAYKHTEGKQFPHISKQSVNSLNSSALGGSQSSTMFTFPKNVGEFIQLRGTYKHIEGKQVDHLRIEREMYCGTFPSYR